MFRNTIQRTDLYMWAHVPNRCEIIADSLLERGYPARVTEKVLGSNFARAFSEIWKS